MKMHTILILMILTTIANTIAQTSVPQTGGIILEGSSQKQPAQGATAQNPITSTQITPQLPRQFTTAPNEVICFVFFVMTLIVVAGTGSLARVLRLDKDWTFADAISGSDGKPSISRLIAFLGFIVMISLILGIGYSSLWVFLVTGQLPNLSGATTFLLACSGLFAPYLANQVGLALGPPLPTPQPLAPVVLQTANSAIQLGAQAVPIAAFGRPIRPGS